MTARQLDRWIRRVLLSTVPLAGLNGCGGGSTCEFEETQQITVAQFTQANTQWPIPLSECRTLCAPLEQFGLQLGDLKACIVTAEQDAGEVAEVTCLPDNLCNRSVGGRRPAGFALRVRRGGAGGWLAEMARLEAASVPAFRMLRAELLLHGAPAHLARDAERAARDEVRHACIVTALARRAGAEPGPVVVTPQAPRDLEAVAAENAVEGCVRETWGVLVAAHQAVAAADHVVRRAMAGIARDETRHAALAWRVDAWAGSRLGKGARRRVRDARVTAAEALVAAAAHEGPSELGLPGATRGRAMAEMLASSMGRAS